MEDFCIAGQRLCECDFGFDETLNFLARYYTVNYMYTACMTVYQSFGNEFQI